MLSGWRENALTATLGIAVPIIQGPLGGFSSQRLSATVSEAGGLGSFGAHSLQPARIREVVGELRSLTARPFAVNLWVSMEDEGARTSDAAAFDRSVDAIEHALCELGAPRPTYAPYAPLRFEDQVRVLLDERVPVLSFIYGVPSAEILSECREKAIATIGTATTPDEGEALARAGIDVIVASGFEAGGHRGSFLRTAEDSLTGTLALVPQIVDRVDVPVVAAGGIGDARGVLAALALGAQGVQLGTAFLGCDDSGASPLHREALRSAHARHTALTRGFTGRLARGIYNSLMQVLTQAPDAVLPYPLQRSVVRHVAAVAEGAGRVDLLPLWAGQFAAASTATDAREILESLVNQLDAIADPVAQWSAAHRLSPQTP